MFMNEVESSLLKDRADTVFLQFGATKPGQALLRLAVSRTTNHNPNRRTTDSVSVIQDRAKKSKKKTFPPLPSTIRVWPFYGYLEKDYPAVAYYTQLIHL
jgi:hypothetical protein